MYQNFIENRNRVRHFVESLNFQNFIMALICVDAVVLGLLTSDYFNHFFGGVLFFLDRLCMAIFIVEMVLKLYVYGSRFFKSRWNTFDFAVIAVSSFSFASYFIILRTFRLFRLLKYINRFSKLKRVINIFGALMPNFIATMLVFAVLLYVAAIMAVALFGGVFVEFSTLGDSLFALLQVFTLDGWASDIARPVMSVFPHAWVFFVGFLMLSFLLMLSFVLSVVDEIFRRELLHEVSPECRVSPIVPEKVTSQTKRKMPPHGKPKKPITKPAPKNRKK